jgi:hypothetical protein
VTHYIIDHYQVVSGTTTGQYNESLQVIRGDFYQSVLRFALIFVQWLQPKGHVQGFIVEEGPDTIADQQNGLYEGQHVILKEILHKFDLLIIQVQSPQKPDIVIS